MTIFEIINSEPYKNYVENCMEVAKYLSCSVMEPPEISKKYRIALRNYRDFLDDNNVKMPVTSRKFNLEDKNTWKYLTHNISKDKHGNFNSIGVINESWVYKN